MSEEIAKLLNQPTIDVLDAGKILGIGKSCAYSAAKDGSIPTIKIGGRYRVPTAPLRAMLGMTAPAPEPKAA